MEVLTKILYPIELVVAVLEGLRGLVRVSDDIERELKVGENRISAVRVPFETRVSVDGEERIGLLAVIRVGRRSDIELLNEHETGKNTVGIGTGSRPVENAHEPSRSRDHDKTPRSER